MADEQLLDDEAPWDAKDSAELRRRFGFPFYMDSRCIECGWVWPNESYAVQGHDWCPVGICFNCGAGEDVPEQDRLLTRNERLRTEALRELRSRLTATSSAFPSRQRL